VKIATREAFNTEETAAYATDLDTTIKEQDNLEAARGHASPGGAM
jgi:hypothetical protein